MSLQLVHKGLLCAGPPGLMRVVDGGRLLTKGVTYPALCSPKAGHQSASAEDFWFAVPQQSYKGNYAVTCKQQIPVEL